LRVVFIAVALFATVFWAQHAVKVSPTTDMIKYVTMLLECDRAWREDGEQLKTISENNGTGTDNWYLYHKESVTLELYFTYTKGERKESYAVFCITEWGTGIIKADFYDNAFLSGSFNDQRLERGENLDLQAELGSILRSIRQITREYTPSSTEYLLEATALI
jgi:hypothetical protein